MGLKKELLFWNFNLFLDVSYAGSCIEKAQEWVRKNNVKNTSGYVTVKFYDKKCGLFFRINCSCGADELANDCGLNQGGLWFNHFIAKGNTNIGEMDGKVLKVTRKDDQGKEMEFTQTSQVFCLSIEKK